MSIHMSYFSSHLIDIRGFKSYKQLTCEHVERCWMAGYAAGSALGLGDHASRPFKGMT